MGGVAHAGRLRAGRAVRQLEVVAHHPLLGAVVELLVLLQIGLHDAQPHVVDEGGRRAVEPHRAVARERREQDHAERERQPRPPRVGAIVGQHRRACEHRDRDEGEAPDADQRRALRQHQRPGQRVAIDVPGKSAEQMAAQPLGGGERDRKRDQPRRPARPQHARERQAEGRCSRPCRPAARSPRTATASRRSWHRPERRSRPNRARRGNSRSRTTSRRSPRSAGRRGGRPRRRRPATPGPGT